MSDAAFGWNDQRLLARSRTALIQAASRSPLRAAAALYALLRASERRISSLSSSPSPKGGLPGGRLASSMARSICPYKTLDKRESGVYSVRTLLGGSR
jgi:hypothetical protein